MYKMPEVVRNMAGLRATDRRGLSFLYLSISLLLVGNIIFCGVLFIVAPEQGLRALGPVLISLIATTALILLARGRRLAAIRLLVYGGWLILVTTAIISAGLLAPGNVAYALIVVMGGWLLGRRHAVALAALTVTAVSIFATGEIYGFLPLRPQPPAPALVLWITQVMIVAIAAALIAYVLRRYDERYRQARQIAENVPAMIFRGDRELRCRFANQRYAEFYGYAEPNIIGMNLRDILGPSVFGGIRDKLDQALAGEAVTYQGQRRAADGRLRDLQITLMPDVDPQGKVEGFYAMILDITDRLHAEEDLCRSEEKFAKAFQLNPMAMSIVRQCDARYVEVNKAWEQLFGWTRDEVLGKTDAELGIWPDTGAHATWIASLARDARVKDSVATFCVKSGEQRQVVRSTEPISLDGDACTLCMSMDVTERLQAEAELRDSQQKFTRIFQLTPLATAIVNLSTARFVEVNSAWENLMGRTREEAIGHTALELGIWPTPEARERSILKLLQTGDVRNDEIEFVTREGKIRQILISAELIDLDGEPCSLSMAIDITDRKQAEVALRESEARARAIADGSSVGIFMLTPDGQTIYSNPAIHKIIGCSFEETLGLRWADHIHPDDRARIHALWLECVNDGIVRDMEYRFVRNDGDIRYVQVRTTPVEEGGRLLCYVGNVEDVTDRQHAEKALRQSEEKLAKMFHASPVAISLSHMLDGLYLDVNEAYVAQFGWSREEMIGRTSTQLGLWSKEARDRWIKELRATGQTQGFEATFRSKSGTQHTVLISAERFDLDMEECVIALVYDITDRKRAEEALRQSEARARVMAEGSSIGIFLCAADGETIYTNPAIHRIIGCEAGETLGNRWTEHVHPEDRELTQQTWLAAVATRTDYELDYRFVRKDGGVRHVHVKAMAVNEGGQLLCYVGNVEDITERKQADEEILRLNAELESRVKIRTSELRAANRELESFAYSISHDLRAPLRGIDGFSQLLLDEYGGRLDMQGRDYLSRVRRAAQRMGILIDDLLELSRVTRQGMRREAVNLSQLAQDILDEFRKAYPQRAIAIQVATDCHVEGDPQLLRVLLENLLDNAWKYTSKIAEAQIEFGIEESAQERVYFVRDNGAGFDMQYADRLFRPFQRLHSPEDFEGTGIGLASVARIVHRHGGRVWAESAVGQGATFHFTLGHLERQAGN